VTNRAKNAKIPKDKAPAELTLDECQALLAAAPERRARGAKKKTAAGKANSQPATDAAPAPAAKKKTKKTKAKKKMRSKAASADPAADRAADADGGATDG
jgi:DNA topoisomerase-1